MLPVSARASPMPTANRLPSGESDGLYHPDASPTRSSLFPLRSNHSSVEGLGGGLGTYTSVASPEAENIARVTPKPEPTPSATAAGCPLRRPWPGSNGCANSLFRRTKRRRPIAYAALDACSSTSRFSLPSTEA